MWVCGLTGLAAIPVAFLLIRRTRNAVFMEQFAPVVELLAGR
jgi:hypothetical protein